jgi:hypothetical protein
MATLAKRPSMGKLLQERMDVVRQARSLLVAQALLPSAPTGSTVAAGTWSSGLAEESDLSSFPWSREKVLWLALSTKQNLSSCPLAVRDAYAVLYMLYSCTITLSPCCWNLQCFA